MTQNALSSLPANVIHSGDNNSASSSRSPGTNNPSTASSQTSLPSPFPGQLHNNRSNDLSKDSRNSEAEIRKLQQQLHDIKEQVRNSN